MISKDALVLVFLRNAFYRRMYLLALGTFSFSLLVLGVLLFFLYYLINNPTKPLYFATDNVSRLINIIPTSQPNMTTEQAMDWSIEAVQAAYSYDFVNYRAQLQRAEQFFTSYGWRNYMRALTASNNLLAITQRKQVAVARVVRRPKVIVQGLLGGSYAWKFQMPLLVTYSQPPFDEQSKFYNALDVTVVVQRQPILQGYRGLAIVQIISTLPSTTNTAPPQISRTPT